MRLIVLLTLMFLPSRAFSDVIIGGAGHRSVWGGAGSFTVIVPATIVAITYVQDDSGNNVFDDSGNGVIGS